MNGHEEPDPIVVATKPTNKAGPPGAEPMERRVKPGFPSHIALCPRHQSFLRSGVCSGGLGKATNPPARAAGLATVLEAGQLTIWRRNSGEYGTRVFGMMTPFVKAFGLSTNPG